MTLQYFYHDKPSRIALARYPYISLKRASDNYENSSMVFSSLRFKQNAIKANQTLLQMACFNSVSVIGF